MASNNVAVGNLTRPQGDAHPQYQASPRKRKIQAQLLNKQPSSSDKKKPPLPSAGKHLGIGVDALIADILSSDDMVGFYY